MAVRSGFLEFVLGQFCMLHGVRSRRMFGGAGLYRDDLFFGIVHDDTLYLRTGDASRGAYLERGMRPFRPYADRPEVSMNYHEVPADVLDDPELLAGWALRAVAEARAPRPVKPRRPRSR